MKQSVFVVEDNAEFRESAVWWLEGLGYAVESFDSPQVFVERARSFKNVPQQEAGDVCVLLDVRMPELSGLQVHDALIALGVRWPVIYMTGHGDVPLAVQAMQKGAVTFLEKPFQAEALEQALHKAFTAVPEAAAAEPVPTDAQNEFEKRLTRLTVREREVLQLVLDGRLNKTIADMLGISIKTVELHRSRVMTKMEAQSLTHLVKMVARGEAQTA
jgi:two-component system, LuxR family, response regulator FixJ